MGHLLQSWNRLAQLRLHLFELLPEINARVQQLSCHPREGFPLPWTGGRLVKPMMRPKVVVLGYLKRFCITAQPEIPETPNTRATWPSILVAFDLPLVRDTLRLLCRKKCESLRKTQQKEGSHCTTEAIGSSKKNALMRGRVSGFLRPGGLDKYVTSGYILIFRGVKQVDKSKCLRPLGLHSAVQFPR